MMRADRACAALPAPADALLPELIEDLLGRGTRVRIAVAGASMAQRLRVDDHVIIEPLHGSNARFGDLVLFRNAGGALVLHRVIRRWRRSGTIHRLQTRGDANIRLDARITAERVLGRVRHIDRTGRDRIDLETGRERFRALAIGLRNLLCSGLYYKLALRGNPGAPPSLQSD